MAASGGEKKRKRVAPILLRTTNDETIPVASPPVVSSQPASPVQKRGQAAGPGESSISQVVAAPGRESATLWAVDSENRWEIWATNINSENTLIRGLRDGQAVWEHAVCSPVVQHIAVDGDFVALGVGLELHILSASSGRMVYPPFVLGSAPYQLVLTDRGQLLALLRDATLAVWDLPAERCVVQTTLQGLCQPGDLELLDVRPSSSEPFVVFKDRRLMLFRKDLQAWVTLTGVDGLTVPEGQEQRAPAARAGQDLHLENDVLVAACLGDAEEFRDRLEWLVRHYSSTNATRLRGWCSALLGQSAGVSGTAAWLAAQLKGMDLDGKSLLREIMLPVLTAGGPGPQEMRIELQEVLAADDAAKPIL